MFNFLKRETGGFHSQTEIHGRTIVKKIKLPDIDGDYAKGVLADIETYEVIATSYGILIPKTRSRTLTQPKRGIYEIVVEQENVGEDLAAALSRTNTPLNLVAQSYLPAFERERIGNYQIALDPVPANFSSRGHYLDLWPPRQHKDYGPLVEYGTRSPHPYLVERYFSGKKALVAYSQLLKVLLKNPRFVHNEDNLHQLKGTLEKTFGQQGQQVLNFNSSQELARIVRNPSPGDCDLLRAIAAEAVFYGVHPKFGYDQFGQIFADLHIAQFFGALPDSNKLRANARTLQAVYNRSR